MQHRSALAAHQRAYAIAQVHIMNWAVLKKANKESEGATAKEHAMHLPRAVTAECYYIGCILGNTCKQCKVIATGN